MKFKVIAWLATISVIVLQAPSVLSQTPAPATPAVPAQSGPIPLESFAKIPFVESAHLSPDGTSIAGLFGLSGRQVISVVNLFKQEGRSVAVAVPDATQVNWLRWVNNDNLIIGISAQLQVVADERWPIYRIIGINSKTGKITRLLWGQNGQNAARVLWVPHDGSSKILVAAQNSIYLGEGFWPAIHRVDVVTGKSSQIQQGRPNVINWDADAMGTVRTGVSYDDGRRKFRLLYRGEGASGGFSPVDTANASKQETLLEPMLFIPGTDHALAMHDDGNGHSAVYEVDLKTQDDVRTVFAAPEGSEAYGATIAADGQTLLGVYLSNGKMHWFDPILADVQAALDKSVGTRRARIIDMSDDRTRLLVIVDRADSPGAVYFFDLATDKMQRIAYINDALETRPLAPVKLVQYKARDGLPIEAVLTLPRGRTAKNLPIVIMPHGGPWARDAAVYDYWAQFVASRGYAVLQPNFRGSTGYGTRFERAGEGQMGLAMQDDLSDGLLWAEKEGIADPKRACIMGASYGGYAAMWGIARDPDQYRCSISIAGVANVRREVNDFGNALMGGKYMDDWKRMSPDFAAISPINAVARIKTPLLLIHGKKDITVDFNQSTSMFKKMRDAGKQVEFVPLAEADHHYTREADRIVLLKAVEAFLLKHNPPDPAPQLVAGTAAN